MNYRYGWEGAPEKNNPYSKSCCGNCTSYRTVEQYAECGRGMGGIIPRNPPCYLWKRDLTFKMRIRMFIDFVLRRHKVNVNE